MVKPFVKWVGGKSKLIPEIINLIPNSFNFYHEPFLGGGALYWYLASNGYLDNKISRLTDINDLLINTYQILQENHLQLNDKLFDLQFEYDSSSNPKKYYYDIREKFNSPLTPKLQLSAYFIFLNKTCFNGVYRENSKGEFNVPFGKYITPLIFDEINLSECNKFLNSIKTEIEIKNFKSILEYVRENDLIYCDPPYMPISKTSNFTKYDSKDFTLKDHVKLRDIAFALKSRNINVIISNSNHPEIIKLYDGFKVKEVNANRSVNSKSDSRGPVTELLIY